MVFERTIEAVGKGVDDAGVAAIVAGVVLASVGRPCSAREMDFCTTSIAATGSGSAERSSSRSRVFVAADIIRTSAV